MATCRSLVWLLHPKEGIDQRVSKKEQLTYIQQNRGLKNTAGRGVDTRSGTLALALGL